MVHKNLCRLLVVLLAVLWLAVPAAANQPSKLSVEREVYDYLTNQLKLSNAAACGVLANIERESSFQPTIVGDQGTSYGLCQWHNERFSALRGYCTALGLDYRTVQGQMAYLRYELGNKYTNLLLTLQSLENTAEGAYRAAYLWCVQFEMPSNMQVKAVERGELAQGKYWVRYSSYKPIVMVEPEEIPEPDPQVLLEQLKQQPVAIPLPPEEEAPRQEGAVRYFRFEKPAFLYYMPLNLPKIPPAESPDRSWGIPALATIGAAMVVVVLFPTKKLRTSLYRRGKYMVK